MEFGILFTSHPNTDTEPYPHRDVHARVTREILRADELGYDYAWVAEHHFSNEYGIMPDVFVYAAYLAALTKRIKIGTAVVTLPLANPVRVAENAAFIDILSKGRFVLGLGSGYRKYEFDGFGVDFEGRRDIQEEALPLLMELLHKKRADHHGKHFQFQDRRRLRAVSARPAAAAPADLPRRRDRALDRSRGTHGLRAVVVELDAVCGIGAADRQISCLPRRDAGGAARQSGTRSRRRGALGLCGRDRRQSAARERGRPFAPPCAFLERPHVGLSRHRVGKRRHDRPRLRRAVTRYHFARFTRDRCREDRAAGRADRGLVDHAALSALVRGREGASVTRIVRR